MFQYINMAAMLGKCPHASAALNGSGKYPSVSGKVSFYETKEGVIVVAQITGLPKSIRDCKNDIFGFHIHSGESCSGDSEDPFKNALTHYNPEVCMHPYHAGDMPPLFGNGRGNAFSVFMTDRFVLREIIGKTVIIHSMPDDFTTQPGGNSGEKIACGVIER